MIKGIGIDLVDIGRIQKIINKWGKHFLEKIYTTKEIEYCLSKSPSSQHFAARFAAKEAVVKMLGNTSKISWQDIEVVKANNGSPKLLLYGYARIIAEKKGINNIHITLSHEKRMAVAQVIGEGELNDCIKT